MDPGTALGVVSLALDVVKDVYKYYNSWKGRDEDIDELKRSSSSLENVLETIEETLDNDNFDHKKVQMILDSVQKCQVPIDKLKAKMENVKRGREPKTVWQKLDDQRRRALYPFKRDTIAEIVTDIVTIRREVNGLMLLLNLDTTAKTLAIGERAVSLLEQSAMDVERQKVFNWLAPIDQSNLHEAALARHEPGTGGWFLDGQIYSDWRSNENSSMWICANAGIGKTVLFSSVVKSIEQDSKVPSPGLSLAYFYCSYRKGIQHGLSQILRTLIRQLCSPNSIPGALQTLFLKHSSKFPPGIPSNVELRSALKDIILGLTEDADDGSTKGRNVFVLLDALDELSNSDRGQLIEFLVWLSSCGIEKLHVLATSRELSEIKDGLKSWGSPVFIDKIRVADDIRLYVDKAIEQDSRMSQQKESIRDQIKEKLVDDTNPLFRWTALQLDAIKSLRPMRPRNVLQTLNSLPKDLNETYTRILNNIPKENSQVALRLLRWISLATRPLFIEEIVDACAIYWETGPEFDIDERYRPEEILDTLPGLLAVNPPLTTQFLPETHTISFAHFSVLEYLRKHVTLTDASFYHIDSLFSNLFIAKACLVYLVCTNTIELRKDYYPLRGYAWDYWAWHALCVVGKDRKVLHRDIRALFGSVIQPDQEASKVAIRELEEKLAYVDAEKQDLTRGLRKSQYSAGLRLPFFYDEFDKRFVESTEEHESSVEFTFAPLEPNSSDIRLIELFPSDSNFTEVRCRLFHVSLEDKPKYDGVSYHWSKVGKYGHVRVNGLLHAVPQNLVSDLQNLRVNIGATSRVIFVDAISFRSLESSLKTSRMPRIFKQAAQVAIGLGGRADEDTDAIKFIHDFVFPSAQGNSAPESLALSAGHNDIDYEAIGQSIFELFQRGWWLRMWPVQEIVLPQKGTLYYGATAMTFDTIVKFFHMEDEIQKAIKEEDFTRLVSCKSWIGAKRVSSIRSQYQSKQYPTLPQLLWATQYHTTVTPAVKVYGLLGMLDPEEGSSKLLDFGAQISVGENFTRAALHIFSKYRNLDILSQASARLRRGTKIYDAAKPGKLGIIGTAVALSSTVPTFQHQGSGSSFAITALSVPSSIYDTSSPPEIYLTPSWVPDFASNEWGLEPLITGIFGPPNDHDVFNAGKHEGVSMPEYSTDPAYIKMQGIQYDFITEFLHNKDTEQIVKHRSILCQNMKLDEKHFEGRQMFTCAKGNLCLGSININIGDIIVVMPGGKVPYVLRSMGDDYMFIGDCYVDGIMHGEAITAAEEAHLNFQHFRMV